MVTLGFGFKTYLAYKWRLVRDFVHSCSRDSLPFPFILEQRKQRDVRKTNETYIQLINQALPIEVQQEAEKERLSREKGALNRMEEFTTLLSSRTGTFSEHYEDVSQANGDGTYPTSPPASTSAANATPLSTSSHNSPPQSNHHHSSSFCTVSKRSSKLNSSTAHTTDAIPSLNSNSIVQTTVTRNPTKIPAMTTTNGHDDGSSSYKQQKSNPPPSTLASANPPQKKSQKSSNTQQQATSQTQSRRQPKKQEQREQTQEDSRDSSSSHVNGFSPSTSVESSDIEKK